MPPMNITRFIPFIIILIAIAMFSCNGGDRESSDTQQNEEGRILDYETTVTFLSSSGDTLNVIDAAIADDESSRSEGLMNVTNLPENAGMIFIFNDNQPRSFWMASTPLSLDILFVNEDFEIVRIHRNTSPYSQESIPSERPAKYVVEVNAGYTTDNDINEGGRILVDL